MENTINTIYSFFEQKGRAKDLTPESDLFSGGYVDSLFAFEIVQFLESTFSIKIPNKEINEKNFKAIKEIAALVSRLL